MLRRLLIAFALLLVGLVAAVWWASQRVKQEIASGAVERLIMEAVKARTGIELELGAIRLATFPVLAIEKVRIKDVGEDVLRFGALRVRLDATDYLAGRLVIDEIRLVGPRIHLERDAQGQLNVKQLIARVKAHVARLREEAKTQQQKDLEKVLEDMKELEKGLPPRKARPSAREPEAPPPSEDPPPAPPEPEPLDEEDEEEPDPRGLNQGPVVLRRIAIQGGRLRFVDASVGDTPFRATLDELDLGVVLPEHPGDPVDVSLTSTLLGAPLSVTAEVDPLRRRGPIRLALRGLPLGAVQPYIPVILEKRRPDLGPLPIDLGQIPLHLEAKIELDGKPVDYDLELEIPESKIQVEKDGRTLEARFAVEVGVRKDHAQLRKLTLALGDALGLEVAAEARDFKDPKVKARVRTTRFDLTSLLDMAPPEKTARIRRLEPRLEFGLDAIVEGKVKTRELKPDVSLELGPASVQLKLAEEPLPVEVSKFWLRLAEDQITLKGLEVRAAGVKLLEGDLEITDWKALPRLGLKLGVPDVRLAELLQALPGKIPLRTEKARKGFAKAQELDLDGSLGLTVATTVDTAVLPELESFREVTNVKQLVKQVKAHPELKKELLSPAGLAELERLGVLELGIDLDLGKLRATVRKGAMELPVEVEGALRAGLGGLEVKKLVARVLGAAAEVKGRVKGLPGPPELDVALHVGAEGGRAFDLTSLIQELPAELRDKAGRYQPSGVFEASASVQGPVTSPEVLASVALQSVGAKIPTPGGPEAVVQIPRLDVKLEEGDITVGPSEIQLPLGPIGLAAQVDDLRGEKRFRARIATPGQGLDLLKILPFLPEEKRQKLEARKLERAQLDLRVDASGTPAKPEAHVRGAVRLPTSKLLIRADATDLKGAKNLSFDVHTGPGGIRLDKLARRLPPHIQEKLKGPLNGGIELKIKGGGSLANKESLKAKAQIDVGLPGGDIRVRAKVDDPLGEKRFSAGIETEISKLDEILAFLPDEKADKVRALSPSAQFVVSVKAQGTPKEIRAKATTGLKHAALLAPLGEERMPVVLEPATLRASAVVRPRKGAPPELDVTAGLTVNAVAQHPEKGPLDLRLAARDVHYDGKDLELGALEIQTLSQPITVAGTVSDIKGAKFLDLKASLGLTVPELVARLVPPEAEIRSNGTLKVDARIGGTAVRPDWDATVKLKDFFLDAYKLKGIPVSIDEATFKADKEDLVIEPFRLKMGGNDNQFFLTGSFKELTRTENFWRALKEDRDAVVGRLEKIMKAKGGKTAVVKMVGNETLLRILGSSAHKIIIHVDSPELDRPFTFKTLLTGDESKYFDYNAEKIIEKYREVALTQLRGKVGVTKRLFGKRVGTIARGGKLYVVVLDQKFNMVYPDKIPFWRLTVTPVKF